MSAGSTCARSNQRCLELREILRSACGFSPAPLAVESRLELATGRHGCCCVADAGVSEGMQIAWRKSETEGKKATSVAESM